MLLDPQTSRICHISQGSQAPGARFAHSACSVHGSKGSLDCMCIVGGVSHSKDWSDAWIWDTSKHESQASLPAGNSLDGKQMV